MRRVSPSCVLLALVAAGTECASARGNDPVADAWPGAAAKRQAARCHDAYNALVEHDHPGRGLRIVAIRCLPSTNARYYCHTTFRSAQSPRARIGLVCVHLELQPPFTVLGTWPVVCDDGSGAVFTPMPKTG